MPRFRIYGTHRETGNEVVDTITADRPQDAQVLAEARQIEIGRIVEIEYVHPPASDGDRPAGRDAGDTASGDGGGGESVVWRGHPSQWVNAGTFTLAVLFCWLLFPVVLAVIRYLQTRATTYTLTDQRLRIEWGLLGRDIEEVELYRIKDSSLQRTFIDKLRRTGTVRLDTSDRTAPVIWLRCIRSPAEVRERVRGAVEARRETKRVREVDYA